MSLKFLVTLISCFVIMLLLIFGITYMVSYNKAVKLNNSVEEANSAIIIAIEARYDMLETLLEAVEGLENHVESQLEKITEARTALANASANEISEDLEEVEASFSSTLVVILEDNQNFTATSAYNNYMVNVETSINAITYAKNNYNKAVRALNNHLQTFPNNLVLKNSRFNTLPLYNIATA